MNVYNLNDYFEFHFSLSRFDTGAAADADATPTWRVYEENNDTVVTNDDCAKRDDANTLGYYYARGQITSGAGYEVGKNYVVRAAATVNSVAAAAVIGSFKVVSVTRGLAGTALPDAAADGAGGLPISDAGGLDLDTLNSNVSAVLADTGTDGVLLDAAYDAAKTASQAGDAMTLTGDYDAAKTAAQSGDPMTLADDAITAGKFDESSAFPLAAADAGSTQIARVGADSDTLETLSDQIDAVVADTNELQTDLTNGGRLDLLIDAIKAKTDLLPVSPAKNEALAQFVFLMVDNTDHITPKEGLTVTGEISKDGGAFAALSNAIGEISDGYYKITGGITQAEMNADVVALKFSAVGADQRSIIIVTSS